MFKYLCSQIPKDKDYPPRQFAINVLTRVLRGKLYDVLTQPFAEERNGAGEYVELRKRRPSVRHNLCRIVVDDSVSLLFSEGHFPTVTVENKENKNLHEVLTAVVKESKLNALMIDAATKGSVGSVAIFMRVLSNRLFFDASVTEFLTPSWDPNEPDQLLTVTERYKVKGSDLIAAGYTRVENDNTEYWLQTIWDRQDELHFHPVAVNEDDPKKQIPRVDKKRTVNHRLGFVPIVWIKNLPGGDDIDGEPTFPTEAIDTMIEIDYQLSQAGRGLKYSSDPTLLIKEPTGPAGKPVQKGGAANAIIVSEDGDAKLLEISGSAANAVIDYVKFLRECALEGMHGNKSSNEKIAAAQSGRAMEMMNQAVVWLADRLRISYGEGALLQLLKMVVKATHKYEIKVNGKKIKDLDIATEVTLKWPDWYPPTDQDRSAKATALQTHTAAGHLSRETAVGSIAEDYDIEDLPAELAKIKAEKEFDATLDAASKPLQRQNQGS